MNDRTLNLTLRRAALALALTAALGTVCAQQAPSANLPTEVSATLQRLREVPDARLRAEALEALSAFPAYQQALLDGLAAGARPERLQVIAQLRSASVPTPAPSPASAGVPTTVATGQPATIASAPGSREVAVKKEGKGVSKGVLIGGGIAVGVLAAAAGGGGGGSSGGGGGGDTPPPPPPPPPPPGGTPESYLTAEFQRNYGLGLLRAQYAYSTGATGSGVLVAVVDSGLDINHPEFVDRIAPGGRVVQDNGVAMTDPDGHGTLVAGIVAANKNNVGMHGVAFNAMLLPIKYIEPEPPTDGSPPDTSPVLNFGQMTQRLAQYRPRIANNSWGERTVINNNEDTYYSTRLQDVQSSGYASAAFAYRQIQLNETILVFASGNNLTGDVSYGLQPSLWAALPVAFPELQGLWVAVGSVDRSGVIAASSHHCGDAAAWCLVAPGSQIVTTLPNNQYASASGTSMAAPHVSGGLALLADRFPTLTSRQLVTRLLATANKTGIYADQSTYGQGLMDLEAATRPVGSLSAQSASGEVVPVTLGQYQGGSAGDAVGSALSRVDVVLKDALDAPFVYGADVLVLGQRGASEVDHAQRLARLQAEDFQGSRMLGNGFQVSYRPSSDVSGRQDIGQLQARRDDNGRAVSLGFGNDASWSQGLMHVLPHLRDVGVGQAFANPYLGLHERGLNFAMHGLPTRFGLWGVQLAHGVGDDGVSPAQRFAHGSTSSALAEWRLQPADVLGLNAPGLSVGVQLGVMQERDRLFGGRADLWRGSALDTQFVGLDLSAPLGRRVQLVGRYHSGWSQLDRLAWAGTADLRTQGYALGLIAQPSSQWQLGAMAHAPLAISGGHARFDLPTTLHADNTVGWSTVNVGLDQSRRPREVELFAGWRNGNGKLRLKGSVVRQFDPAHGLGDRDTVVMFNASVR